MIISGLIVVFVVLGGFVLWESGILGFRGGNKGKAGFSQIDLDDWALYIGETNRLTVKLINKAGDDVYVEGASFELNNLLCVDSSRSFLPAGKMEIRVLNCDNSVSDLYGLGDSYSGSLKIKYNNSRTAVGSLSEGTIWGVVEAGSVDPYSALFVEVDAHPTEGNAPLLVDLNCSAWGGSGSYVSYVWSYGDGLSGSGTKVTHNYTDEGYYTAWCTVTDSDGQTASDSISIWVGSEPAFACELRPGSCEADETCIFRTAKTQNSHAGTCDGSSFDYLVCCKMVRGSLYVYVQDGCGVGDEGIISLAKTDNSHVNEYDGAGGYPNDVCVSATSGRLSCRYGICKPDEECIVSLFQDTNSHVGDCDYNTYHQVCCEII